ncbi:MAG: aspartate kinase, partial [Pyrinomonadaceae bacterium]
ANLLAEVLRSRGLDALYVDARQCIITDDEHGAAMPIFELTNARLQEKVQPVIDAGKIPVMGGFIGSGISGATTTLGRGGSDYSAAIVGAGLSAREIQIWTDVPGVLSADPRMVKNARSIPRLSYSEAAELAYFGAKVLHPKTIQPAVEQNIPVRICNSREPEGDGTIVSSETERVERTVKAIAHKSGITIIQVTSARMLGAFGFLRALFEIFEKHRIVIDVVTTSEVSVSLTIDDTSKLREIIDELQELGSVRIVRDVAIICIVGEGLRDTPGIAARAFNTINSLNVVLISQGASSVNLTFAIEAVHVNESVSRLHAAFFED